MDLALVREIKSARAFLESRAALGKQDGKLSQTMAAAMTKHVKDLPSLDSPAAVRLMNALADSGYTEGGKR